jgi:hypothetical protein
MPLYYFTIRVGALGGVSVQTAELGDDAAAFDYAAELAHAAAHGCHRHDPSWLVKISDDARPIVFVLPLFAACA